MEAIRAEGLYKSFGGVQVLSDVSLEIDVGECVALIGPNGAGKTTLFNVLNGQLSPAAGRICFFGQDITTLPTHRRAQLGIARSFQVAHLFLSLTVLENALLALNRTTSSRLKMLSPPSVHIGAGTKAPGLLRSAGLWEKRDDPVQNISYGEQRKLEIALALASEPKLLLLDEPTCGLTAAESAEIVTTIQDLRADTTVLIVAHDLDLVFGVANRIIVLHYGQIIAEGGPEEIQANAKVREIYMGVEEQEGDA